jgi:hypothetical protein
MTNTRVRGRLADLAATLCGRHGARGLVVHAYPIATQRDMSPTDGSASQ